jgi:glc operon protein GlcG
VRRPLFIGGALLALSTSAAAAQSPMGAISYIDSARVAAAFAKGMPLIETGAYKIHASRRDGPGKAEIHVRDTDIIYVLAGGATFVTGGTAIDPQTIAPDEIRGTRIDGGATQVLAPGDIIIVPNGTPHWFKEVRAPFLYYTVKVTQTGGM